MPDSTENNVDNIEDSDDEKGEVEKLIENMDNPEDLEKFIESMDIEDTIEKNRKNVFYDVEEKKGTSVEEEEGEAKGKESEGKAKGKESEEEGKAKGKESEEEGKARGKESEEKGKDSEKYQTLFRNATDIMLIADSDLKIKEINDSALEIFGYDRDEIIGWDLAKLFLHPGDFEQFKKELLKKETVKEYETKLLDINWKMMECSISCSITRNAGGDVQDFPIIVQETVQHSMTEEALWESLQTSADIVQAMPSGLLIFKYLPPDWFVLLDGNPTAEKLTGLDLEDTCGTEFNEIWPGADEQGMSDAFIWVMETGEMYEKEDLSYHLDDTERFFKICAFQMPGKRLGVAFEDITESKKAREALHRRLKFEKVVADISSRFVGTMEINETINSSLADIGGLCGAKRTYLYLLVEDGSSMDMTHEWNLESVEGADETARVPYDRMSWLMERLRERETIHIKDRSELPPEAKDEIKILGNLELDSLILMPLFVETEFAGFVGCESVESTEVWTAEDLAIVRTSSEVIGNAIGRERAEQRIIEEEKKRKNVVINTAHLLQTPLTVIKGNMELVRTGKKEFTPELLEKILRRLEEMKTLVDGKLYANIELMTVKTSDGFKAATSKKKDYD